MRPAALPAKSVPCLSVSTSRTLEIRTRDKRGTLKFEFDRCFDPLSTQLQVFEYLKPAIEQVVSGVNTTVFAYGQTGTGKTHTMLRAGLEGRLTGNFKDFDAGTDGGEDLCGIVGSSKPAVL